MNIGSTNNARVEAGYYWVWAVFMLRHNDDDDDSKDATIPISVQDPLYSSDLCRDICAFLTYPGSNVVYQEVAMGWQQDGWRCGYYCLYAMLHASWKLAMAEDDVGRAKLIDELLKNPKNSYKEMPDGFVEFVWRILKINCESNSDFDVQTSHIFFRSFFDNEQKSALMECSNAQEFQTFTEHLEKQWNEFKDEEIGKIVRLAEAKNAVPDSKETGKSGTKRTFVSID